MAVLPVLILGQEPRWIQEQVGAVLRSLPEHLDWVRVERFPEDARACLIATDDLTWPPLRRLVARFAAPGRMILMLSWARPIQLRHVRQWPLYDVFTLPQEADRLRSFLQVMRRTSQLQFWKLNPGLPGSVAVALRHLLRVADSLLEQPPPRSCSGLADILGMDRSNLARQSCRLGLDLGLIARISTIRWIHLNIEAFGYDSSTLATRLGYRSARSLRRFVRTSLGAPIQELATTPIEDIDRRLLDLLNPVLWIDSA